MTLFLSSFYGERCYGIRLYSIGLNADNIWILISVPPTPQDEISRKTLILMCSSALAFVRGIHPGMHPGVVLGNQNQNY